MKKIILLLIIININSFSIAVTEVGTSLWQQTANQVTNAKNLIESTQQNINLGLQLQNDLTNLESWGGVLLGEQNAELGKTLNDLQAINEGSQSIIRDSSKFESNFDRTFQDFERYKEMDNKQLIKEGARMNKQVNSTLKDSLKVAAKTSENIAKETKSLAFMGKTDGAKGNMQVALATKKVAEMQNNKLARIENLAAEQLRVIAITEQKKMTQEEMQLESFKNSMKVKVISSASRKPNF